jgi:hypothetical protein
VNLMSETMAKPLKPKTSAKKKPKPAHIELQPDAWDRFEKAVGTVAPPKRGKKDVATLADIAANTRPGGQLKPFKKG